MVKTSLEIGVDERGNFLFLLNKWSRLDKSKRRYLNNCNHPFSTLFTMMVTTQQNGGGGVRGGTPLSPKRSIKINPKVLIKFKVVGSLDFSPLNVKPPLHFDLCWSMILLVVCLVITILAISCQSNQTTLSPHLT